MAWNNQGGPWGGGQSPWGRGGGGGNQPPDFEEMIKRGQDRMKSILPGGFGSGRALALIGAAAVVLWLVTGFYVVNPGQVGVNMLFGRFVSQTLPGLRWNWPVPIGDHYTPDVATRNRVEVGFRAETASGSDRDVPEESLMLTGNENIIDVRAVVLWRINNVEQYLFGIGEPEASVKNTVEAALREIIGQSTFEYAITEGRGSIELKARDLAQQMLDSYRMGDSGAGPITIEQLSLQKVDAPSEVIDAFRDVQKARADKEAAINDAQAYFNQVTEEAIGQSTQIVKQAEAYKAEKVAIAQGDAQRFISIYNEYKQAPDITERRLYLESMSGILAGMNKIIIDEAGGAGAVPYLPLDQLLKQRKATMGDNTAPAAGSNAGAAQ
ncbi:FtsH protease activity modulator HflK [Dongia sp.]|jgi:membrane protease subunit HflK|uniref:FtsH protease activity modulator HflK n=1 Tax=Dongia sp. TaxID=1977262 RepID=UPI0035B4A117